MKMPKKMFIVWRKLLYEEPDFVLADDALEAIGVAVKGKFIPWTEEERKSFFLREENFLDWEVTDVRESDQDALRSMWLTKFGKEQDAPQ
jgi:hypothetical protein